MNFLTNKFEFITCFQFCCVRFAFAHKQDRNVATTNNNGVYCTVQRSAPHNSCTQAHCGCKSPVQQTALSGRRIYL